MSDAEILVELPDEQVLAVARLVHEQFRANELAEGRLNPEKPSHQEWDQLTEDIRSRNYAQVRAYPAYLALAGLAIVPAGDHAEADTTLSEDAVERLAQLEHNRWMEREIATNPRHECVLHWDDLDESTREKDRQPVRNMASLLSQVGLAVVPLPGRRPVAP